MLLGASQVIKMKAIFLIAATLLCSAEATQRPRRAKVLILGAGVSGISAAETLYSKGLKDFLILEGKDYVGGRIHRGPEGKRYPLGAGQINDVGPTNAIWKLAKKLGLKMHKEDYDDFVVRNPSKVSVANIWKKLKVLSKDVEKKAKLMKKCRNADTPLRSVLGMVGWNSFSPIDRAVEFHQYDLQNGVPAEILSGSRHGVTSDSIDATITDLKGLEYVLEYLSESFNDKIVFNSLVSEIQSSDSGVSVLTADGRKYTADQVLVTFSPGVLSRAAIKFSPPLPKWKMDAFHVRPMSYQCKIYLQFPLRFWDHTNHILFARTHFGQMHWNYFDKSNEITMDRTLLLQLTGDQCLESEQMSDKDVIARAMKSLKEVYGENIPSPKGILRSDWNKNNMTLGSQSYPVVGFTSEDLKRLQAPVGRVWFAGEYISNGVGTVASAYVSGKTTSKNIIACIQSNLCQVLNQKC